MHTVFALPCFVVVIHWLIFPYPSGLLHWHCGNLTIAPVPATQPWWIWINTSCEFIMNDCITTTKQSTTEPCAYFLGYTVTWTYWGLNPDGAFINLLHRSSLVYMIAWHLFGASSLPKTILTLFHLTQKTNFENISFKIYKTHVKKQNLKIWSEKYVKPLMCRQIMRDLCLRFLR